MYEWERPRPEFFINHEFLKVFLVGLGLQRERERQPSRFTILFLYKWAAAAPTHVARPWITTHRREQPSPLFKNLIPILKWWTNGSRWFLYSLCRVQNWWDANKDIFLKYSWVVNFINAPPKKKKKLIYRRHSFRITTTTQSKRN